MRHHRHFNKGSAALFIAICMAFTASIDARKIRTKLPVKSVVAINVKEDTDNVRKITITKNDSAGIFDRITEKIRFYGFDKTLTSTKESFFIINGLDSTLTSISIEITYFDMHRRQLHKSVTSVDCNIPGGETRRVDIKSWDTQKAFYFHQSAKPRRQATPFDVTLKLNDATLSIPEHPVVN